MAPMFTFHEVPTVISVCRQCPATKVGFDAGTPVECRISMAIVVGKVEEAVETSIEGDGKMLCYGLPSVVALDEEETAFVVGIGLCLIEMSVLTGVFLHVAIGIQSPIALQFGRQPWYGISQTEVVRSDTVGRNLRIAHQGLHRILLDSDIAYEGNL